MLQEMRENSRSAIIYVLFGILIAAFVISFGPQSGQTGSCGTVKSGWTAKVAGSTISDHDWRYGYIGLGLHREKADRLRASREKEQLMDRLIEREILAREAARLGFRVSREEAEDLVQGGRVVILGDRVGDSSKLFYDQKGKGIFRYKRFKDFARQLTDTEQAFLAQQQKELLALKARQVLEGAVVLSPAEVEAQFKAENDTVSFDYVRFSSGQFLDEASATEADAAAFLKDNEAKVKAEYEKTKAFAYEGLPPEVRTRHILVKVEPGAPQAAVDAAKSKADALRDRVTKLGEPFEKVAAEASDDKYTAKSGGDLRWRGDGQLSIGDEVDKAVKAAKEGDVTPVVRGSDGWEIVKVVKRRKGSQSFDDVKLDIAQQMAQQGKAKALAKAKAEAALSKLKEEIAKNPAATLEVMFDKEDMGGGHGDLPPGLPPELLKQLPPGVKIEMAPPGGAPPGGAPPGGGTVPVPPVTEPGEEGTPAPAQPAPSGAPGAPPVGALRPWGALGSGRMMTQGTGTGTGTGTAGKPAAGGKPAGKPPIVVTPVGKGAPPVVVTPGKPPGNVPPVGGPAKPPRDPSLPKIEDSGILTRAEALQLEELGKSSAVVAKLFGAAEKTLLPELIESDAGFLIIYLRTRTKPDLEDFAKRKAEIGQNYAAARVAVTYRDWIKGACVALAGDKKIDVNRSLLTYDEAEKNTTYEPCKSGFFDLVRR